MKENSTIIRREDIAACLGIKPQAVRVRIRNPAYSMPMSEAEKKNRLDAEIKNSDIYEALQRKAKLLSEVAQLLSKEAFMILLMLQKLIDREEAKT